LGKTTDMARQRNKRGDTPSLAGGRRGPREKGNGEPGTNPAPLDKIRGGGGKNYEGVQSNGETPP